MTSKHFVFLLFIIAFSSQAQDSRIDSLLHALDQREVFNREYVDLVNNLSFEYLKSDPTKAPYYTNLAISVSKEINYQQGLIRATTNKGSSFWVIGLQDEALSYYLLSLSYDSENYPLEYVRLNNNIGEVFKKKSLYDSSQKYYRNALRMIKKSILNQSPEILYYNIGEAFFMQKKVDSAEYYYRECLKNSLKKNNKRTLAYAYAGLAEIAHFNFDIVKAEKIQEKSLNLRLEINDTRGIINSYIQLGTYAIHAGELSLAFNYWNKAEKLSISFRALDLLNEIYLSKSEYYYFLRQYKEAAEYIGAYLALSDSIKSKEFTSSLERTKTALLSEVSDAENKLLKEQQKQAEEEYKIFILYAVGVLIVAIAFYLIVLYYRKKKFTQRRSVREGVINDSLLNFSKEVNLGQLEYDDFINNFLLTSREILNSDRASYWSLNNRKNKLICYRLADSSGTTEPSLSISEDLSPRFFRGLMSNRAFSVSDINRDPRCTDINPKDLLNANIISFLAAPLHLNNQYIGMIGYSMIDSKKEWSFSEQRYVGSLADILVSALVNNQRKTLEIEKQLLIDKLTKKNKSLKEFNSVVSHNLREPLTQVIGFSNLLSQESNLTIPESDEIISRLSVSSEKIDSVIKDLSTLLNEHDLVQKDIKSLSLQKVIDEVLDVLSNDIRKAKPVFEKNLRVANIKSYKPFIFDIIYHLISNSLKFRKPRTGLKIEIFSWEDENKYYLKFSDNGRGIDLKSFQDRIFKMYMRHHQDIEGRGVGLYLTKNRVESLNGEIEVESQVMEGTSFTITLPKKGIN